MKETQFLELAEHIAGWSKDPSTQVGAVIVRPDRTIASVGYNGFPRGVADDWERLMDRELKNALTVHAELNAILNAHERLDGCTIYVTHPPCVSCAAAIIQSGIKYVAYKKPDQGFLARWQESIDRANMMFHEADVFWSSHDYSEVAPYGVSPESLLDTLVGSQGRPY